MKNTILTAIEWILLVYLGGVIGWEIQRRRAAFRYAVLKSLYHNYRVHHQEEWLGRGYNRGFVEGVMHEEAQDEIEEVEDELREQLAYIADHPNETFKVYPFGNRNFG